jgi:hypothetical protein
MPNDMHGIDGEVFLVGDLRVDVGQQRVTPGRSRKLRCESFSTFATVAINRARPTQDTYIHVCCAALVFDAHRQPRRLEIER